MKDIAPELLEKIKTEFNDRMKNSNKIKAFEEILKSGNSNYMVANDYAIEVGEILVDIFKTNISSEILPNGKMYYNIADRLLNDRLKENYNLISEFTKETQTQINNKIGLSIKGAKSKVNQNRIDGIINRVSDEDNYDDISWIMEEPIVNFSQSVVDDVLNTNINLHYDLGLKPRIIRKESGNCCDWCREIVGKYDYPNVPDDIYKRHRFCRCTVEYDPGDGKRQNVHTKKWREVGKSDKIENRKSLSQENLSNISDVRKQCLKNGIQYNQIKKHKEIKSEKDIIKNIGGLDKTKGSCSSVALAYAGNKGGYDVLDFRGGKSCDMFAQKDTIKRISKLSGVKSFIVKDYNDHNAVLRLTQNMVKDKEYYLATGGHAAIIRKTSKGLEYLELQDNEILNGYKKLNNNVLTKRFGCKKSHNIKYIGKVEAESILIDIDSLKNNEEFEKILGFINTNSGKQLKGSGGSVK